MPPLPQIPVNVIFGLGGRPCTINVLEPDSDSVGNLKSKLWTASPPEIDRSEISVTLTSAMTSTSQTALVDHLLRDDYTMIGDVYRALDPHPGPIAPLEITAIFGRR